MNHAISNLLKNNLDAISNSGTIGINGEITDDQILITIKDSGAGMDQDILGQIFEPFFTTKGGKGTGLGMSIVKNIVEAHQGTIECQSRPNEGTTFFIRLPLTAS
jgi:signal transduction histidine kinase